MKIAIIGWSDGFGICRALADAGNEVWAIDTWQEHIDAINKMGFVSRVQVATVR